MNVKSIICTTQEACIVHYVCFWYTCIYSSWFSDMT